MKSTIILVTFLSLALLSFSSIAQDEGLELRKSFPIQVYMGTCVVGRADPKNVAKLAKEKGFSKAPKKVSKNYLSGNKGKVWHLKNNEGEFAISVLKNGLCSVFVHQGIPEQLKASMESWLPPKNVGFSYETEESEKNGLTTTVYKLYRGKNFLEQWVITLAEDSVSGVVAIMSYNAPKA